MAEGEEADVFHGGCPEGGRREPLSKPKFELEQGPFARPQYCGILEWCSAPCDAGRSRMDEETLKESAKAAQEVAKTAGKAIDVGRDAGG